MKTKKLPQAIAALKKYKEQNNLSFHELEKQTGVASATLNGWCTGRIAPLHSSLEKIKLFLDRQYSTEFSKKFSNDVDYIDSRLIAEWIGRDHKNLLSDIRKHIEHLEKLDNEFRGGNRYQHPHQNADITSPYRPELYFIKATYVHSQNKMTLPYYLVTQLGCDLIRNRLKGVRGTQFAVLYINEFHRMKENEQAKAIDHDQKEAQPIEQEDLFKATSELQEAPQWSDEFLSFDYQESLTDEEKRDLEFLRHKLDRLKDCNSLDTLKGGLLQVVNLIKLLDK